MSDSKSLHDLFVDELKDSYDHEKQLVKALRKMASAATHPDLKAAFTAHLGETQGQIEVLEEVFGMLDMKPKGKHCAGIAGIIEEGGEAIEEMDKSPVLDVALIGGGKRAEHYEIAAYQAMIGMANTLGMSEAADKIQGILDEEVACDAKLDALAEQLLPEAAQGEEGDDESDDEDDAPAKSPARKPAARKAPAKKRQAKR
ncbi:MAG: ferritin-like domain-containing protein [Gemmatimonadaceae bacterium]